MKEIYAVLPPSLQPFVEDIGEKFNMEEIRLRSGQNLAVLCEEGEFFLESSIINGNHLDYIVERSCDFSVHSVQEQISRGYLTITGGHRIGLCGTVVEESGRIKTIRRVSSLSIRVAKEVPGIAEKILPKLLGNGGVENTLLLAPPGLGKTTLLRDVIRGISNGVGIPFQRVGVVDERSEVAGMVQGLPGFDIGIRTDVLDGCRKSNGLLMMLRSMNPEVLAVDEITEEEDVQAFCQVNGCGVKLLATAHGENVDDFKKRPIYRELLKAEIFRKLITIRREEGKRIYEVEELVE